VEISSETVAAGQAPTLPAAAAVHHADEVSQYLTFTLGPEEYGIELLKVQEIRGYSAITPIPNTPSHVKGVMNLRGTVIPVVDLRSRFGLETVEYTKFTVIIVASVGEKIVGIVVDAVSDVLTVSRGNIRATPDFGVRAATRFITGLTTVGDHLAVLLDIEKLVSSDELAALEPAD